MEIKFDKFGPVMRDSYPLYVINARYVGGCYLCVHDPDELIEKHKHPQIKLGTSDPVSLK